MSKQAGRYSESANDFLQPLAVTSLTATDVGTNRPYSATANTTSAASAAGTGGAVNLSWTLPANSPAATSYTITSTPATYTVSTGSSTPSYTFEGLASNTSYTFTVVATNAVGSSDATTSSSVTVTTVPNAPQSPSATAQVLYDTIDWTDGQNGGQAITSYTITSSANGSQTGITSHPYNFTESAGAQDYYVVYALNANGTSAASAQTGTVTTQAPFFPPFFPPGFFSPPGFFAPPGFFHPPGFFAPPGFFHPPGFFSPPRFGTSSIRFKEDVVEIINISI